jgi:hypothetical protein
MPGLLLQEPRRRRWRSGSSAGSYSVAGAQRLVVAACLSVTSPLITGGSLRSAASRSAQVGIGPPLQGEQRALNAAEHHSRRLHEEVVVVH